LIKISNTLKTILINPKYPEMKFRLWPLTLMLAFLPLCTIAQRTDTLIKKLDSLGKKTDSANGQSNNINRQAYNENTKITFPVFFILLASDLKQEITKPFHMEGKDWLKFGKFVVVGVAVGFADEPIQRWSLGMTSRNTGVANVSKYVTRFGGTYEIYTLSALAAYGFIFKSEKIKTTTLLAAQAYITGGAMQGILKFLTGRQRPSFYDPNRPEPEPRFLGPFSKWGKDASGARITSSFPSGHTTVAFAAATVFAMEYKDRPIVGIISYSAATLIGISRVTENKHWATDVLVGAALGYVTGRLIVNNYHRYAKLKAPQQKKNTVTFNLRYNYGQVIPGIVYTFR
jgi:membrane-associated phospholipid phosphatase